MVSQAHLCVWLRWLCIVHAGWIRNADGRTLLNYNFMISLPELDLQPPVHRADHDHVAAGGSGGGMTHTLETGVASTTRSMHARRHYSIRGELGAMLALRSKLGRTWYVTLSLT